MLIMKTHKLISILLFVLPLTIYCQDTIYLDNNGKKLLSKELAESYKVIIRDEQYSDRRIERIYYKSRNIKSETRFLEVPNEKDQTKLISKLDGIHKDWYENGNIHFEFDYRNNKLNGNLKSYWDNGQLKRHEIYNDGKSLGGKCFNSDGSATEFYPFEIMPVFPGGERLLLEYISRNLKYPVEMQKMGIQGKVIVRFVVSKEGNVTKTEVIRGVSNELDQEALRVVRSLPKWKPGIQDGVNVSVYYTLPITFKLE